MCKGESAVRHSGVVLGGLAYRGQFGSARHPPLWLYCCITLHESTTTEVSGSLCSYDPFCVGYVAPGCLQLRRMGADRPGRARGMLNFIAVGVVIQESF